MNTTWVQYDGWILRETEKAFAVAAYPEARSPEIWIPKKQCQLVTYADGGDVTDIREGCRITAMKLSVWFARKEGLI